MAKRTEDVDLGESANRRPQLAGWLFGWLVRWLVDLFTQHVGYLYKILATNTSKNVKLQHIEEPANMVQVITCGQAEKDSEEFCCFGNAQRGGEEKQGK